METLNDYKIPFIGLKNRVHHFSYKIDESFFKTFENETINDCLVEVKVELEKRENYLIILFLIDGYAHLECDRCLDLYKQEIFGDYKLIVQFGTKELVENENDDDIISLPKNQDFVDLSESIYDYILLCIPFQKVHRNIADCNQEIIQKMNTKHEENDINPMWEVLNKLKK